MSLHLVAPGAFHDAYDRIRSENDLPRAFSSAALNEAFAARSADLIRRDLRHVPFMAIDPEGAVDLDQALHIETAGDGHVVNYAISDVGAFVEPGGALDSETRRRGVTMYFPDGRVPLHPRILSEDRASLLAGRDRPAVVWTFTLDERGEVVAAALERATIRVARAISYRAARERVRSDPVLQLLEVVGRRRIALEEQRGGITLDIPGQRVTRTADGYRVEYEDTLPVERWNAQISIMTGIVAAKTLVDEGVGIVRTLPQPHPDDLSELRLRAAGLGISWPEATSYQEVLRSLRNDRLEHVAFKYAALRTLRGAGYSAVGEADRSTLIHGAIADLYTHVTAPLRRLCDRYLNEILLAVFADESPPAWATEAADGWLAGTMIQARSQQARVDRQVIDHSEATILAGRVGAQFHAVVVRTRDGRARIQIAEPAVVADIQSESSSAGDRIRVVLEAADPVAGTLTFRPTDV